MAMNPPGGPNQPPNQPQPNPPASVPPAEKPEVIVRGSSAYKDYMRNRAGWLTSLVNGLEDYLSIAGRALLLLFLIYTTVKAGMTMMHVTAPIWLEVIMLSLQVAGVEGAVPGLARHKEALNGQPGKEKDARTIGKAITSTRTLAVLTGLEIVLFLTPSVTIMGTVYDLGGLNDFYSKALLIARLVVISNFLIAMARMEHKKPKIVSQEEYDRQQRDEEQEQVRMDNTSIQASISQALEAWTLAQEKKWTTFFEEQKETLAAVRVSPNALNKAITPFFEAFALQTNEALKLNNQEARQNTEVLVRQLAAAAKLESEALVRQLTEASQQESEASVRQLVEAVRQENEAEMRQLAEAMRQESEAAMRRASEAAKLAREANQQPRNEAAKQPASATRKLDSQAAKGATTSKVTDLSTEASSRDRLKAEAYRLADVEGLSSSGIAARINKPAKTIQRWLRERNTSVEEAESEATGTEE